MSNRRHRCHLGGHSGVGEPVEIIARAVPASQNGAGPRYAITALVYGRQTGRLIGVWSERFPLTRSPAEAFRESVIPGMLVALRHVVGLVELGQVCLLGDVPAWRRAGGTPSFADDPLGYVRAAISNAASLADRHRAAQVGRALPAVGDQLHACYEVLDTLYPNTLSRCSTPLPPTPAGYRLWASVLRELRREHLAGWDRFIAGYRTDVVFADLAQLAHRLACSMAVTFAW